MNCKTAKVLLSAMHYACNVSKDLRISECWCLEMLHFLMSLEWKIGKALHFSMNSRCKIHEASRVASIPERRVPKLSLFAPNSECGIIAESHVASMSECKYLKVSRFAMIPEWKFSWYWMDCIAFHSDFMVRDQ